MRHLYLWFLLAFAVTLFGFWPTTVGSFGPPDGIRIVHGVFAVTWMAMLVVQSLLVGRGFRRWHRWIGWTSLIVAPGLVISALIVVRDMQGPGSHFPPDLRLTLTWIDLWSLALFSLLYILAIVWRRTMFLHARLMASTVFVALIPALGRAYGMNIPGIGGLRGSLHPCFWTVEAILIVLILLDGRKGRWATPWWLTLVAMVLIEWTMFQVPGWPAFNGLIDRIRP